MLVSRSATQSYGFKLLDPKPGEALFVALLHKTNTYRGPSVFEIQHNERVNDTGLFRLSSAQVNICNTNHILRTILLQ